MCGGKDRARFDDKDGRGTWICSRCGAGDGVALVMALNGWDFPQAAQRIEALIPSAERVEAAPSLSDQRRRELLNALWRSSRPVQPGDPVALWLGARVGLGEFPPCLRTVAMRYPDDPPSYHPGMLAMVTAADGSAGTLHRTYLTVDGRKAAVEKPGCLCPGHFPKEGRSASRRTRRCLGLPRALKPLLPQPLSLKSRVGRL
jgi:putative DNA primase/helicase